MSLTHTRPHRRPRASLRAPRAPRGFFRVQNPFFGARKKNSVILSAATASQSEADAESKDPVSSVGLDKCGKAFSQGCAVEIPCDGVARVRTTRSFDCVIVRFANDHFAQDDNSAAVVNL